MYISSITKCNGDNLCFSQMTNYCFPKNWKALAGLENSNIKSKNAGRGRVYLIPSSRPLQEMEPCDYFQPMRHEGKGQLGNEMPNSGEGIFFPASPTKVTKETTCSDILKQCLFLLPATACSATDFQSDPTLLWHVSVTDCFLTNHCPAWLQSVLIFSACDSTVSASTGEQFRSSCQGY